MAETRQKTLILILARELATNLATPVFVVDPQGSLVFYNESAEEILGEPFEEAGELTRDQWATMFSPHAPDGRPLSPEEVPLVRALVEHIPAQAHMGITGRDGVRREITVMAFPLVGGDEEFAGAVAFFWEDDGTQSPGPAGPRGSGAGA